MMMHRLRISIIYSDYYPADSPQAAEHEAAESIVHDARRVRLALVSRGDRVRMVPMRRSVGNFLHRLLSPRPDLVFNLCEEVRGDVRLEMHICALLELLRLPYTGCGPLALGVALDKALTKRLLASEGIPTPRSFVSDGRCSPPRGMRFPLFVKPLRHDASIGIDPEAFVTSVAGLRERCRFIKERYRQPALVEEYIEGRELNVAILGNRRPFALPISEIDLRLIPSGMPRVCGYRAKWVDESEEYAHTVPVCPAPLPRPVARRVIETAISCYRLLSCHGYARVDIRLDARGTPYVLEVNPNPCIGPDSGMARSAAAAGMSHRELIRKIADLALQGD